MAQLDVSIAALKAEVTRLTTVRASVLAYVAGVPKLIADAVQKALDAGATAEELQALTDLQTEMAGDTDAMAAAIQANTPTP